MEGRVEDRKEEKEKERERLMKTAREMSSNSGREESGTTNE